MERDKGQNDKANDTRLVVEAVGIMILKQIRRG